MNGNVFGRESIINYLDRESFQKDINNDGLNEKIILQMHPNVEDGLVKLVILDSNDSVLLYISELNIHNVVYGKSHILREIDRLTSRYYEVLDFHRSKENYISINTDEGKKKIRMSSWMEDMKDKNINSIKMPTFSETPGVKEFEELLFKYWNLKFKLSKVDVGEQWNQKDVADYFKVFINNLMGTLSFELLFYRDNQEINLGPPKIVWSHKAVSYQFYYYEHDGMH